MIAEGFVARGCAGDHHRPQGRGRATRRPGGCPSTGRASRCRRPARRPRAARRSPPRWPSASRCCTSSSTTPARPGAHRPTSSPDGSSWCFARQLTSRTSALPPQLRAAATARSRRAIVNIALDRRRRRSTGTTRCSSAPTRLSRVLAVQARPDLLDVRPRPTWSARGITIDAMHPATFLDTTMVAREPRPTCTDRRGGRGRDAAADRGRRRRPARFFDGMRERGRSRPPTTPTSASASTSSRRIRGDATTRYGCSSCCGAGAIDVARAGGGARRRGGGRVRADALRRAVGRVAARGRARSACARATRRSGSRSCDEPHAIAGDPDGESVVATPAAAALRARAGARAPAGDELGARAARRRGLPDVAADRARLRRQPALPR